MPIEASTHHSPQKEGVSVSPDKLLLQKAFEQLSRAKSLDVASILIQPLVCDQLGIPLEGEEKEEGKEGKEDDFSVRFRSWWKTVPEKESQTNGAHIFEMVQKGSVERAIAEVVVAMKE